MLGIFHELAATCTRFSRRCQNALVGYGCGKRQFIPQTVGHLARALWTLLIRPIAKIWACHHPTSSPTPPAPPVPSDEPRLRRRMHVTSWNLKSVHDDDLARTSHLQLSCEFRENKILRNFEISRIARCIGLVELNCSHQPYLNDESVKHLAQLPTLKRLNVLECPISGAGLVHLGRLTQLEDLAIGWLPPNRYWQIVDVALDHLTKRRWMLVEKCHRTAQKWQSDDLRGELQDITLLEYLNELLSQRNRHVNKRVCEFEKSSEISFEAVAAHLEDFCSLLAPDGNPAELKRRFNSLIAQTRAWDFAAMNWESEDVLWSRCHFAAENLVDGALRPLVSAEGDDTASCKLAMLQNAICEDFFLYFKFRCIRDHSPLYRFEGGVLQYFNWVDMSDLAKELKQSILEFEVNLSNCHDVMGDGQSDEVVRPELSTSEEDSDDGQSSPSYSFAKYTTSAHCETDSAACRKQIEASHVKAVNFWLAMFSDWLQFYHKCLPIRHYDLMALEPLRNLQRLHLRRVEIERLNIPLRQLKSLTYLKVDKSHISDFESSTVSALRHQMDITFNECTSPLLDRIRHKAPGKNVGKSVYCPRS